MSWRWQCRCSSDVAHVADVRNTLWLNGRVKPDIIDGQSADSSAAHSGDAYLSLRALASYAGLSVRTLRDLLAHATHPLPHYRMAGKILIKRSEFDSWMRHFRVANDDGARDLVADVLRSL